MKSLKRKSIWMCAMKRIAGNGFCALLLGGLFALPAQADYVGELETTKYFDAATVALIKSRLPGGLLAGDQISYIIQFTPTDNGGVIGAGGFVTDYIPAGTQVIDAQFVNLNSDGTTTEVAPPTPAAVFPAFLPMYTDTGIFYSTDPRTRVYTTPASATITSANGYPMQATGCTGISLPSTTHNAWDNAMGTKFANVNGPSQGGTCAAPPGGSNYNALGLSPVAGPNTFLTLDSTGAVGPWQRISYPGSMLGTSTGVTVAGSKNGTATTNACVGGTPTAAGWNLSSTNPLPINTNAVRFAAGRVTVGELFTARITLKLTANMPATGIINNTEVFGGDIGLNVGNAGGFPSNWNQWRYQCPAVAVSNSSLLVLKNLVGSCTGAGCTPTPITAGVVPNAANLKLRYQIQYVNLSSSAQTNAVLTDTLATGGEYVANSYLLVSGTGTGAPTGTTVLTFPTIASLGSAAGGTIQYDVNVAAAQPDGTALINTAKLVSTQVPSPGVTSKAIATVSSQANLWISKSTSTPSVAPGNIATYIITIPNNGGTAVVDSNAKPLSVNDYLPTSGLGTAAANRFAYSSLVSASTTTAAGVVTAVTPTVAITAPATAAASEQVQFSLPTGTTIAVGGKMTITFNATVGSNVPSLATPYLNNANVYYSDGPGGTGANSSYSETIGASPVTVTAPMTLSKKVNCVYASATSTNCVPYANGTIAPGSKIKYELDYKNISAGALNTLVLTDTLPANTTFVTGTALQNGTTAFAPTGTTTLTFPTIATLAAGASGYVTFDVTLGAAIISGMNITNTTQITASGYPAGVQASVTTSVSDQANLQITKTAVPSTIQIGGAVQYSITVTNTGNASASGIMIYDELPYTGSTANAAARFNFTAGTSVFTTPPSNTAATTLVAVTPTLANPPTFTGYTVQTNRQEILWTFAPAQVLAKGESFTLTYTATAGASVPASVTPYTSDVQAQYISATNTMFASTTNTAPVTVGAVDHIFIQHNLTGLTCLPETLTVIACGNPACTTQYPGTVTATLNGIGNISFSGGSTTASLAVTTPGAFTLGATSVSPAPLSATSCSSPSCTLTFSDAGFILTNAANGAQVTIPNQVAGAASLQYVVRAVKSDKITGACTSALTGAQSVNFGYECNDPTSCAAGNLLSINGLPVAANNNNPLLGYSYTGINLTFDANGNATTPVSFSYEDVGQITLRLKKTVNGATLLGNSNAFTVMPHHLAVDVCAGAGVCTLGTAATPIDGTGAVLAVAGTLPAQTGTAFSATVRSMSANNNVTPNFGTAGSANGGTSPTTETVALTQSCVAPIISPATTCPSVGTLNGTKSITRSAFTGGAATVSDLTWSEVGVITLTASNSSFMGGGGSTGTSNAAGRFRPDHFDTVVAGTMACPTGLTCPAGGMGYSGQVFNSVVALAMNAGLTQTGNYQGAFAKAVNLSAVAATGGASITAAVGAIGGTTVVPLSAFIGGSGSLTGVISTNTGTPWFTFAATPTAPTNVFVRAIENGGDNVTSLRAVATNSVEGGVTVVSGRVNVSNAYGSELLPLLLTATAQYYGATAWVKSITDSVTVLSLTSPVTLVPSGQTVVTPTAGTMSGGQLIFKLSKPGVKGVATISPTAPSYLPVNSGTATFGVYKGTNEFIYQREAY